MAQIEKTAQKSTAKIRFNVVDLVIVIAILACLVGIYLRFDLGEQFGVSKELDQYVLSFEIKNVRYTSADAFPEGDAFFLNGTEQIIGRVIAIDSTSPSEVVFTDDDGNYKTIYYPEDTRIDLTGRLLSEGTMTERGYFLGGNTYVAPGQVFYVETPRINVSFTLTNIQPASVAP